MNQSVCIGAPIVPAPWLAEREPGTGNKSQSSQIIYSSTQSFSLSFFLSFFLFFLKYVIGIKQLE